MTSATQDEEALETSGADPMYRIPVGCTGESVPSH